MSENSLDQQESYNLHPIGVVRRLADEIQLQILEPYIPGLKQLEHFSQSFFKQLIQRAMIGIHSIGVDGSQIRLQPLKDG